MSEQEHDRELVTLVTQALNEDLEKLDPAVRARLAAARGLALEHADASTATARRGRPFAWTLTAVASTAVVILAVALSREDNQSLPIADLDDLELLSSADGLDLLQDLDFYEWLDTEPLG